ncbi:hypothetical protein ACSLVQ_30565, partial [Klebsiella pneumoniae]|uniref:hypothetical protein n=1 Tax=Klebsiella pneumoniae TaxID=573 RepID=UPI003EE08B21
GAVYADLDNDGALDLVINKTDEEAGIYKNNALGLNQNHFINIRLVGTKENPLGLGTKLIVYANGASQYQEQLLVR